MRGLLMLAALAVSAPVFAQGAAPRSVTAFDSGWRFARGDIAGAEQRAEPKAGWTVVNTPHDWAIAGPFDQKALTNGSGAWLPSGVAWYRKSFNLPASAKGRRLFIEFDGVMERSRVWVNGVEVGHRPNGYSSFRYELTQHLKYGGGLQDANIVAVRADTSAQPASRWYAGAGIYRHVRLIETGDVHVEPWGSFVTTPTIAADRATVKIESSIMNQGAADRSAHLEVAILGPDGREVGRASGVPIMLTANRATKLLAETALTNPRRWDIKDPAMHRAVIRVVADDGALLDRDEVPFGVRDARFEAATGFWLNGRNIKLKGAALHGDAGAFGMAAPLAFWERRLKGMQALGVNAIRTSHHPFSPEVLDLADRMGVLVMNEAFDMWTVAKNPHDYHLFFAKWSSIDTRDFVRRDRNHPSVVIWSLGNEIRDTAKPEVAKPIIERLMNIFHEEDPSRPVTMALFRPNTSGDYTNGLADMLDVVGQNYREGELTKAHADKPTRKIIGTENVKLRSSWLPVRDNPAYSGMFLWTGADYLGEANRRGWPVTTNPAGLVDRTDVVKPVGRERASWWSETPVVHIARRVTPIVDASKAPAVADGTMPVLAESDVLADWTPDRLDAHPEKVEVYSNAEAVELFVNGKSEGRKPRNEDDSPRTWDVTFAPGTVRAVAYNDARQVAEETLRTAGAPAAIRLVAEEKSIGQGFHEVGFVRVEVVDAKGEIVPSAGNAVTIAVEGAGALAAYDNGSITDHTMFDAPTRAVVAGRALAMVRANAGSGTIRVAASAPGLKPATATIAVRGERTAAR